MTVSWKVEPLDLDNADDVTKAAYLRVAQHSHNEAIPADGPVPEDELWFEVQNISAGHPKHYWCVWDENRTDLVAVMCVSERTQLSTWALAIRSPVAVVVVRS